MESPHTRHWRPTKAREADGARDSCCESEQLAHTEFYFVYLMLLNVYNFCEISAHDIPTRPPFHRRKEREGTLSHPPGLKGAMSLPPLPAPRLPARNRYG